MPVVMWSVILYAAWKWALSAWGGVLSEQSQAVFGGDPAATLSGINVAISLLLAAWAAWAIVKHTLLWWFRRYEITQTHAAARTGVLRRTQTVVPLRNIQQIVVDRTVAERMLGLGTICITTAGSQTIDLAWVAVTHPHRRVEEIKAAMDAARPMPVWLSEDPEKPQRPVVIGLVGGIGAGKSRVAGMLASLGCIVVDSDRDAKAVLDTDTVREQLVRWWGKKIIGDDGRVDRKAVAAIVFADPTQRTRLEELVHPIIKSQRTRVIERATLERKPGVVIDAPLLFEAESDKECDVVLFVDAPRGVRLERIKGRGWSEAELARREKAQLPLEEKKARSTLTIVNDGDEATLEKRVQEAWLKVKGMQLPERPASNGDNKRAPKRNG